MILSGGYDKCKFSILSIGKIISIDTSSLRAAGRTGWEDLVRKCIYAFFQPQGREPSYARQLFQEGKIFSYFP